MGQADVFIEYVRVLMRQRFKSVGGRTLALLFLFGSPISIISFLYSDVPVLWKGTIAGALGLGFLGVVGQALVLPVGDVIRDKQKAEDALARIQTPEGFFHCAAEHYGLRLERIESRAEMTEEGGESSVNTVTVTATKPMVTQIEHYTSGGFTGGEPSDDVELKVHEPHDSAIKMTTRELRTTPNSVFAILTFRPGLPVGVPLTYSYTETSPSGTYLTDRDEVHDLSLRCEYSSREIKYPTGFLDTKLVFPLGVECEDIAHDVWCDEGQIRHEDEYHRVAGALVDGREINGQYWLGLRVEYPILGLRYVILWRPENGRGSEAGT